MMVHKAKQLRIAGLDHFTPCQIAIWVARSRISRMSWATTQLASASFGS